MDIREPETTLDARFGTPDATATPWAEGRGVLETAEIFWISTVRTDGRPHVTPLLAVWDDGSLYFTTGASEQKARNLAGKGHVVLTTGGNELNRGLDVMVEGEAVRTSDEDLLGHLAAAWSTKYEGWDFEVRDGAFWSEGSASLVFCVTPTKVLGFGRGAEYSATRWRF